MKLAVGSPVRVIRTPFRDQLAAFRVHSVLSATHLAGFNLNPVPAVARMLDVRTSLVADLPAPSPQPDPAATMPAGSDDRPTDPELVTRLAQGDRSAFGELYDRYGRPAYSLARRICVDPDLAEDIVQEAFLALWRNPNRFDASRGGFGTWLMTVVHHRAVDAVRKENTQRRRNVPLTDELSERNVPPAQGSDHEALTSVVGAEVREALKKLPEDQRQVIALAYLGGYTQVEVAKLTGVPLGTVKSRTFAAIRRLRGTLSAVQTAETGGPPDLTAPNNTKGAHR
jgi:RNA polymerase sigma-70 factor (ECF subfamily)